MAVVDKFWAAFWRRQAKHLPPNAIVANNFIHVPPGASGVGVYIGREWKDSDPPAPVGVVEPGNSRALDVNWGVY